MKSRRVGVVVGLGVVVAGATLVLVSTRSPRAGGLVPEHDLMSWRLPRDRSPDEGTPKARATFVVRNTSLAPIRVLSVLSGCDCAIPRVEPELVPPGGTATVQVEATPPESGDRTVGITLLTDSQVTPEVLLRLQMAGDREPPYLARAGGSLSYDGDWDTSERRSITSITVVAAGADKAPLIECDLPFLAFELAGSEEKSTVDPSIRVWVYTHHVKFLSAPPPGRFSGRVTVIDPWDASRREVIPVFGETPAPFEVVPSRLILRPTTAGRSGEAILRVMSREAGLAPDVQAEGGASSPLFVRPAPSKGDRTASFAVGLREGANDVGEGPYNLIVRPSPAATDQVTVPVLIRRENPS